MSDFRINCDMGESFGRYHIGNDEKIMPLIDECNLACGFHAGDPPGIEKTIKMALDHGLRVGAHPSYPDLQGFGRRTMDIDPDELESFIRYQVAALSGLVKAFGGRLSHVKAHGALYNKAAVDTATAMAISKAVRSIDRELTIFAPHGSIMDKVAKDLGLSLRYEAFIDRKYHSDLRLVSRRIEGSVLTDPIQAKEQVRSIMINGRITSFEGEQVPIKAQTLCIHGDNPNAIEILEELSVLFKRSE